MLQLVCQQVCLLGVLGKPFLCIRTGRNRFLTLAAQLLCEYLEQLCGNALPPERVIYNGGGDFYGVRGFVGKRDKGNFLTVLIFEPNSSCLLLEIYFENSFFSYSAIWKTKTVSSR